MLGNACVSAAISQPPDVPYGGYGLLFTSFVPNVRVGMLVYRLLFTWLCLGVGARAGRRGYVGGVECITVPGDVGWG